MVKRVLDKTLFKFVIIGIINTLLGMAIMFGLYNLAGVSYWLSTAANYVIVSFLSFYLNRRFTFRYEGGVLESGLRFAINIGVCYLLAYGIAKPWLMLILQGQSQVLQENAAMLVGMCLFTGFNYLGQRWFVFRGKGRRRPLKTREELKAELERVMEMDDRCDSGQYYDQEAHIRRRNRVIRDTYRNVYGAEPPLHVVRLIKESEACGEPSCCEAVCDLKPVNEQELEGELTDGDRELTKDGSPDESGICRPDRQCKKVEKLPEMTMTDDGRCVCVIVGEVQ